MSKRNTITPTVKNDDPLLPTREVTVAGKVYTLCFNLRSLARAERELRALGHDVSLLSALPGHTLDGVITVFAAAARRFHPELTYEAACGLLKMPDLYTVAQAIADLWAQGASEAVTGDEKNPTQPGS